jgi:hypothetical protein
LLRGSWQSTAFLPQIAHLAVVLIDANAAGD